MVVVGSLDVLGLLLLVNLSLIERSFPNNCLFIKQIRFRMAICLSERNKIMPLAVRRRAQKDIKPTPSDY